MTIRVVLSLAIAVFSAAFALQNANPVTVVFIIWRFESSLALVLIFTLLAGALIVAILAAPSAIRARLELASRERRASELSNKIEDLERILASGKQRHQNNGTATRPGQDHTKLV